MYRSSRPNTTFLDKYLNLCLLAGGVLERKYRKLELLYLAILIVLFFILVLGEIIGFMNHITNVTAATEIMMDASILFFLIGTFACVRSSEQTFRHFLVNLHSGRYRAAGQSTDKLFKKRLISISPFFISMITAVLTIIVPVLYNAEFDLNNKNLYLAPFWFECPKEDTGVGPRFPIKWLCLRIDSLREFLSVNIFLSSFILWGFIPYSTLFTFCVFIVTLLKEHTKGIELRINGMERRLQPKRRSTIEKIDEITELVEIIKYHQFVEK